MARRIILSADQRLDELPTEALECRVLRHNWPRMSSGKAVLSPTKYRAGRVVAADREMECQAGCGTIRVDSFVITGDGRMYREGAPKYRRTRPYLLTRSEDGTPVARVDPDVVRYAALARFFPDLRW